jgi:hypothetical protein
MCPGPVEYHLPQAVLRVIFYDFECLRRVLVGHSVHLHIFNLPQLGLYLRIFLRPVIVYNGNITICFWDIVLFLIDADDRYFMYIFVFGFEELVHLPELEKARGGNIPHYYI